MNLKILEFPNRNLCLYENELKLFYSKCTFKWGNRKTTEIFDNENRKIFEVNYNGYFYDKFQIIYQSSYLNGKLKSVDNSKIITEDGVIINRKRIGLNITNSNFHYYLGAEKIATSKVLKWVNGKVFEMEISTNEKELQYLLIIKFLIYESGKE
ncbi:hypothetical protein [Flavobacterium tegetincola]|uniref:hypothetical protein n=1 Tax=Flavobacterium tegetincola TaxID=150172 RepID=UPI00047E0773|nr:hypothetical protein [Flavobacterium tegetincola]